MIGSQQLTGNSDPQPSSLKALFAATPFYLTYNANGLVVRVQEQYIP